MDRWLVLPNDHDRLHPHFPLVEQHRVKRFIFDVSYWVLVPLLLLNMVSGVILDRRVESLILFHFVSFLFA